MTAHELAKKLLEGPDLPVEFEVNPGDTLEVAYAEVREYLPSDPTDTKIILHYL